MKTPYVAGTAMLIGIGLGAAGVTVTHAQTKAPVYFVAENTLNNPEGYKNEYLPKAKASIKAHGGRYVAAGAATPIVGEAPKGRVVILEWDSMEQLKEWFNSPDYQAARKVGEKYATYVNFAVPGVAK